MAANPGAETPTITGFPKLATCVRSGVLLRSPEAILNAGTNDESRLN